MLRSITLAQFREWGYFYELEPFGEVREDHRMANAMQLLANINRDPKKRPEPYTIEDFILKYERDDSDKVAKPKKQTVEEMTRLIEDWIFVHNEIEKNKSKVVVEKPNV